MLVYFLLLCFCSGLTQASSTDDDDASLDYSLLVTNSLEYENVDSDYGQSYAGYSSPTTIPPLRKSVNISAEFQALEKRKLLKKLSRTHSVEHQPWYSTLDDLSPTMTLYYLNSNFVQQLNRNEPTISYPSMEAFLKVLPGRIVGGRATSVHRFPYTVAILRGGELWCGGALIEASWVLTAAHCVKDVHGPKNHRRLIGFKVRAGSSHPDHGGILTKIKRAFFPSQYQPFLANFDYSLLQLPQELPLGSGISLVRLPAHRSEVKEGQYIVVTGWGSTTPSGQGYLPSRLRYVTIPVMSRSMCQRFYYFPITANMICASYPEGGMDACNHDSGGPATYNDYLVGIVSFGGRLCGDPKSPGVYSRVSKATKWIVQVIKQISGLDLLRTPESDPKTLKRIGKQTRKRTHNTRTTKRSSRIGHDFKEIGAKFVNRPLKERYKLRYNTGVFIKRIGEERKLLEFQPHSSLFTEDYQKPTEFLGYTKVPIRKMFGRRVNFFNYNVSDKFSRNHNVTKSISSLNLTDVDENQDEENENDSVDSDDRSALQKRGNHRSEVITNDTHNGKKLTCHTST